EIFSADLPARDAVRALELLLRQRLFFDTRRAGGYAQHSAKPVHRLPLFATKLPLRMLSVDY
ncbi:MAG: hypothetical protein DMD64_00605, partial [Gemmatimonadetes bacterium]